MHQQTNNQPCDCWIENHLENQNANLPVEKIYVVYLHRLTWKAKIIFSLLKWLWLVTQLAWYSHGTRIVSGIPFWCSCSYFGSSRSVFNYYLLHTRNCYVNCVNNVGVTVLWRLDEMCVRSRSQPSCDSN